MSVHQFWQVSCDCRWPSCRRGENETCGAVLTGRAITADGIRITGAQQGWRHTRIRRTWRIRDLCPECADQGHDADQGIRQQCEVAHD